ncbi:MULTISPECIES: hypothetical protein [unclassified Nocardioides]|uniref:hypothetical protein n=1 Tax=unclassified Nocardioides TaxID=2615069 RepID=UPI0036219E51
MNLENSAQVQLTLLDMEARIQNPPATWQMRINGRTPLDRTEQVYGKRRQQVRDQQRAGYQRVLEAAVEKCNTGIRDVQSIDKEIQALRRALRNDPSQAAEIQKWVSRAVHELDRIATSVQTVQDDEQAAMEVIDQDPAEWEASLIERFPGRANGLPVFTEGWLRGEKDAPDPLGGER